MNNVKMCARCNAAIISNLHSETADYYRHISIKYCDQCRQIVKREQTARRVKALKERKKAEHKQTLTKVELLEKENEALRQNYIELMDIIEALKVDLKQNSRT